MADPEIGQAPIVLLLDKPRPFTVAIDLRDAFDQCPYQYRIPRKQSDAPFKLRTEYFIAMAKRAVGPLATVDNSIRWWNRAFASLLAKVLQIRSAHANLREVKLLLTQKCK